MGIEIEKKFTIKELPNDLSTFPHHIIEQGYLNVSPAVRVRREDDNYYMTYKGSGPAKDGGIGKVEYNMPLDADSYANLVKKCDGNIIKKTRYLLPLNEDAFDSELNELIEAAKEDLSIAGVTLPDPLDAICNRAIITYCKCNFGSPNEYDRLKASYDEQKAQLSMATGYTTWIDLTS